MTPEEQLLEEHLRGAAFLIGEECGNWRLVSKNLPDFIVAVMAAPRDDSPREFFLRFNAEGYNAKAPTATLWDMRSDAKLAGIYWPRGTELVAAAFQPGFLDGRSLYLPCDRVTIEQHGPEWAAQYPRYRWTSKKQITFYLEVVHELLTSPFYAGAALLAA